MRKKEDWLGWEECDYYDPYNNEIISNSEKFIREEERTNKLKKWANLKSWNKLNTENLNAMVYKFKMSKFKIIDENLYTELENLVGAVSYKHITKKIPNKIKSYLWQEVNNMEFLGWEYLWYSIDSWEFYEGCINFDSFYVKLVKLKVNEIIIRWNRSPKIELITLDHTSKQWENKVFNEEYHEDKYNLLPLHLLNEKQYLIYELLINGYNKTYIAKELNTSRSQIERLINTIYNILL